jgi:Bacterial archaeo-eukaryotic release factor family 11
MLHIDIPSLDEFKALAQVRGETCVSLYLPTSHLGSSAKANRTAFKDLAREALSQLKEARTDKAGIAAFERQFESLAGAEPDIQDKDKVRKRQDPRSDPIESFWHYQASGLAALFTSGTTRTFRLPNPPKPLAEVADRFHLTPLIRAMTSPHDVYVLALAKESARLVHAFANFPPERLHVPGLPANAEEATRRPSVHVRAPRGHLQNLEGEKVLLQQYVRTVEQALSGVLAGRNTPLVLAAAEPLASMFRSANTYSALADEMIEGNPDPTTDAELEDAAIPILDRLYSRDLAAAIARCEDLKPSLATTDVSYAAHAATAGAIDQLLVDLDAVVPGVVSDLDGSVTYAASDDAETYSVVDEVARRALFTGARVMGARREELPDRASLIAILRYAFH